MNNEASVDSTRPFFLDNKLYSFVRLLRLLEPRKPGLIFVSHVAVSQSRWTNNNIMTLREIICAFLYDVRYR